MPVFLMMVVFLMVSCAPKPLVISNDYVLDIDRFEEEIKAFEHVDRTRRYNSGNTVFVGSSSIRMWENLESDLNDIDAMNRGFGGSTIPEVYHYFDRIVSKYKPGRIVIYAGENDIAEDADPVTVARNFEVLIKLIRDKHGAIPVYFISLKPSPARWSLESKFLETNERIKNYCAKNDDLFYIDIHPAMINDNKPDPDLYVEDDLHMSRRGYEIWLKAIQSALSAEY